MKRRRQLFKSTFAGAEEGNRPNQNSEELEKMRHLRTRQSCAEGSS